MIIQSTSMDFKNRNQANRECLYAWYPEVINGSNQAQAARDIYIHKGIDRSLLPDSSSVNQTINSDILNESTDDIYQRYKQSIAPSERVYQSAATIDDALKTPWALHYEIERRPATPNISSNSSGLLTQEEIPLRRLKSAPLIRSHPATSILTVPEPQFITPIIPPSTPPSTKILTQQKSRASSAKARLNTTLPANIEQMQELTGRTIKSAMGFRSPENVKVINEERLPTQVDSAKIEQHDPPLVSFSNHERCASTETKLLRSHQMQITSLPPNLHHIHRPGVISANNQDKKSLIRTSSASKKSHRRRRRSPQSEHRRGPLLAITPVPPQSRQAPIQINGINLIYDPTLTLDDPSSNLKKYFIEGHLYLIKDQHYNVINNVNPSYLENYSQSASLPARPKYYQTIPIEKFQIPKPSSDVHYNASETFFYNTIPKRRHRYVIDPNFISENLNVNRICLNQRPPSASIVSSSNHQTQRSSTQTRTVYG